MEIINISKKKYDELTKIDLPKDVISTEAVLYKIVHHNEVKVFKNLHRLKGPLFGNKLYTLTMLDDNRELLPDSFVLPDGLCSVNGNIAGFTIPFVKGINFEAYLNNPKVLPEDKLVYLIQIGKILEQMDYIRNDTNLDCLYINDLHASNFILDPIEQKIKVIDLDSCRICDSKPFPARYLTPLGLFNYVDGNKYEIFRKEEKKECSSIIELLKQENFEDYYAKYKNYKEELGYVNSNRNSDLYCYTIMVLNYLYGHNVGSFNLVEFYNYMLYLEQIGVDHSLIKAIHKILSTADNENIYPYLKTLTNEQVFRANSKVYNLVRK